VADLTAFLSRVALDRARLVAPFVIVGIAAALFMSAPNDIEVPAVVLGFNVFVLAVLVCTTAALWFRRVPARLGHAMNAVLWWIPVTNSLLSYATTHNHVLVLVLLLEMALVMLIVSTRTIAISFVVFDLAWIALRASVGGPDAPIEIETVMMAQVFGLVGQVIIRRHLVIAEQHERLQEQLLHAQRMDAVGTLAAGVAHDMNNVLQSIMGLAEGLAENTPDVSTRDELAEIAREAERGAELTHGLLAYSRRGKYRKQVMRVSRVVDDVVPILTRTLPKTVHIRDSNDTAGVFIDADATQLKQALINLAVNAADAMSGKGTLVLAADAVDLASAEATPLGLAAGRYARLCVTDTGSGIDDVTLKRMFEPFFTTKPRGKGTGLGLSIVYGIAKTHGGTVAVRSELGRGSTFSLYVPVADGVEASERAAASGPIRTRGTVLVIDDEPGVRRAHQRVLERMGLAVLLAQDGEVGLRLFDANADAIGLVVLDMGMPVMGGAECFRNLRQRNLKVPVLVVTGYAEVTELAELVDHGAVVLEKPFPAARLTEEVAKLLPAASAARAG
jgi:signal transduction histidine kinase/CheY-like chemotaxis protein